MKERFAVLDIYRGIFSTMIVLFHLSTFSATPILNNTFIYNSFLFVDAFFVLSGFVIAYSYPLIASKAGFTTFYKRRFLRLYPLHIFVFLVFILIELGKHTASAYVHVNRLDNPNNNITTVFTNIFLLNSVKFPGVTDVSWNIASWSISAEMISYLLFGVVILAINKMRLVKFKWLVALTIVIVADYLLFKITGKLFFNYSFDWGFLRGIAGFFFGVLCFCVFSASKNSLIKVSKFVFTLFEIAAVGLIIAFIGNTYIIRTYGIICDGVFFITIFTFAFEKGWISTLLKKVTIFHKIGKYSYSIYMIHTLILSWFNIIFIRLLKFQPSAYSYLFVINYIIIYYAAAWTYKHVEMRFTAKTKTGGKSPWAIW